MPGYILAEGKLLRVISASQHHQHRVTIARRQQDIWLGLGTIERDSASIHPLPASNPRILVNEAIAQKPD